VKDGKKSFDIVICDIDGQTFKSNGPSVVERHWSQWIG